MDSIEFVLCCDYHLLYVIHVSRSSYEREFFISRAVYACPLISATGTSKIDNKKRPSIESLLSFVGYYALRTLVA